MPAAAAVLAAARPRFSPGPRRWRWASVSLAERLVLDAERHGRSVQAGQRPGRGDHSALVAQAGLEVGRARYQLLEAIAAGCVEGSVGEPREVTLDRRAPEVVTAGQTHDAQPGDSPSAWVRRWRAR
jgi:hypothetical protein